MSETSKTKPILDLQVAFSSIDVKDRIREDLGDIDGLAQSISEIGLLNPLVVESSLDDAMRFSLKAGGRRWTALKKLIDAQTITERFDYRQPISVRRFEDLDDELRLQIELEENFRRKSMAWQEEISGIARYHRLKVRRAKVSKEEPWTQAMTAQLFNVHQPDISIAIRIDEYLRQGNARVKAAENAFAAIQCIFDIELDIAQKEQLARLQRQQAASVGKQPDGSTSAPAPTAAAPTVGAGSAVTDPLLRAVLDGVSTPAPAPLPVVPDKPTILGWYHHGNAIELLSLLAKTSQVNHILTDPPYGIEMDHLTGDSIVRVADTHGVEENLKLIPDFLRAAFDVVAEDGFLAMWYDLDHHEKIRDWATKVGWRAQRWPLHWAKTTPCSNSQAQYNLTKSVETAFIFRRSEKSLLALRRSSNYISGPNPRNPTHPFVKPSYVWEYLLETLSRSGQTVLDPFAGEGSSLAAAHRLGRIPLGFEIDEKHIAGGLHYITEELSVKKNPLDDFIAPPLT